MRLAFKFALLRTPPAGPGDLHASADGENPVGRWVATSLDLKTLVAIAAFTGALITSHVKTAADIAELRQQNISEAKDIQTNAEKITRVNMRINDETVKKETFEQTFSQLNITIALLAQNQQQLTSYLLQGAAHQTYTPPAVTAPAIPTLEVPRFGRHL